MVFYAKRNENDARILHVFLKNIPICEIKEGHIFKKRGRVLICLAFFSIFQECFKYTTSLDYLRLFLKMIDLYCFVSHSRIFHSYRDVINGNEGLQNLQLCSAFTSYKQGGIFIAYPQTYLRHRFTLNTLLSLSISKPGVLRAFSCTAKCAYYINNLTCKLD